MSNTAKIHFAHAGKVVAVREYSRDAPIEAFLEDREAVAASLGTAPGAVVCDSDPERACAWSVSGARV